MATSKPPVLLSDSLHIFRKYSAQVFLFSALGGGIFSTTLSGCASIFNGSEQDVPVKIPKGTIVRNYTNGTLLPLYHRILHGDSITYLRLKRKKEYVLSFLYRGQETLVNIPRSIDGGWVGADFFFYVFPLIVDGATGSWNTFEGVQIVFPDSTVRDSVRPEIGVYQPGKLFKNKLGLTFHAAMGSMGPTHDYFIPIIFTNEFLFGVGYDLSDKLSLIAEWNFGTDIDLLAANTKYVYDYSAFSSYQLQTRYQFFQGFFGKLGAGVTSASVDSVRYYDEYDIRHVEAGVAKTFPTVFAAIGYCGNIGFVEFRHTIGLGRFTFLNGEQSHFQTSSLHFGLNLHF